MLNHAKRSKWFELQSSVWRDFGNQRGRTLARIMHHAARFCHIWRAAVHDHSVLLDRREVTRCATR